MNSEEADRLFWIAVRSALLAIVDAIERRWGLGKYAKSTIVALQQNDMSHVGGD